MNLYKKAISGLAVFVFAGFFNLSQAASISVSPVSTNASLGDSVFVDILYDGTGTPPSYLSTYDLDVYFDDSIIEFVDVAFDPSEALNPSPSFFGASTSLSGGVNIIDLSLTDPSTLMADQDSLGNSFVLATLEFIATGLGTTGLDLELLFAGDELGSFLSVSTNSGSVTVSSTAVSSPAMLLLFSCGLIALIVNRKKVL